MLIYTPPPLSSQNNSRKGDANTYVGTNKNFYQDDYMCPKILPALRADAENGPIWDQLFILKVGPYGMHEKKN